VASKQALAMVDPAACDQQNQPKCIATWLTDDQVVVTDRSHTDVATVAHQSLCVGSAGMLSIFTQGLKHAL
jgi:hypothetical protein